MRISVHTLGTRGDVQPYVALALGLQQAGHEVLLVAPVQFSDLAASHGIGFAALPAEFLDMLEDAEFKGVVARGVGPGSMLKVLKRFKPMMAGLLDAEWAAANSFHPDVMVYHPKSLGAPRIAEHLGIAAILASPLPGFTPTSEFPTPLLPFADLGPLNALSHTLTARSSALLFGGFLRGWQRRTFGADATARRASRSDATLYGYSPSIVPVPHEWGSDVLVSGCWFLDENRWQPSPALASFLAAGPPPVYVGFGSMPIADAAALTDVVVQALNASGRRGLLAAGWGGLGGRAFPANVHLLDSAPHDQLFPQMSIVVHHGGAGTTAAGLRAGKPTVICPFFGDQSFWGRRVAMLGAGPPPLPARHLSSQRLAAALDAANAGGVRASARRLGEKISAERGIEAAVAFIERHAGSGTFSHSPR